MASGSDAALPTAAAAPDDEVPAAVGALGDAETVHSSEDIVVVGEGGSDDGVDDDEPIPTAVDDDVELTEQQRSELEYEERCVSCLRGVQHVVRSESYADFFAGEAADRVLALRSRGDLTIALPPRTIPRRIVTAAALTACCKYGWGGSFCGTYGAVGLSACTLGVAFGSATSAFLCTRIWSFHDWPLKLVNATTNVTGSFNSSASAAAGAAVGKNTSVIPGTSVTHLLLDLGEGALGGASVMLAVTFFLLFAMLGCAAGALYCGTNVARWSLRTERGWWDSRRALGADDEDGDGDVAGGRGGGRGGGRAVPVARRADDPSEEEEEEEEEEDVAAAGGEGEGVDTVVE